MSHAITAVLRTRLVLSSLNTQLPFSYTQSSALQRTTPVSVWARTPMLSALLERLWERVSSMQRPSLALSGAPAAVPDAWAAPSALEWDGLLLAAPKKKVSHSRKAMRAANKGLKDRVSAYLIRELTLQTLYTAPAVRGQSCSITCASIATATWPVA